MKTTMFTDDARKTMQSAEQIATASGNKTVNTLHILLALVRGRHAVGWHVLRSLGCELDELDAEVIRWLQRSENDGSAESERRLTECMLKQSHELGHSYIGTEHILLGILNDAEGLAARLLRNLDLTLETTKAEVKRLLG